MNLVKLANDKPVGKGARLVVLTSGDPVTKKFLEYVGRSSRLWDLFIPLLEKQFAQGKHVARLPRTNFDAALPGTGFKPRKWFGDGQLKFWIVVS
jgi:hypothetical protein